MAQPLGANREAIAGHTYDWRLEVPPGTNKQPVKYIPHRFTGYYKLSFGNRRSKDGKYRTGESFFITKVEEFRSLGTVTVWRPYNRIAYEGGLIPLDHLQGGYNLLPWNWNSAEYRDGMKSDMSALGAQATNQLRPDLPSFDLATQIGEMKDIPGQLRQATNFFRGLIDRRNAERQARGQNPLRTSGQWYLAISFGWIPVIRSAASYVQAQRGMDKRLKQLIRDAGKPVRRRTSLRTRDTTPTTEHRGEYRLGSYPAHNPVFVTQCYGYEGLIETQSSYQTTTWAVAKMHYYLPPGPRNVPWKRKLIRRLLGGMITPHTFYELMPWSWLIDYYADVGQFVKAISGGVSDRLVFDYCYIMQTREWKLTTTCMKEVRTSQDGAATQKVSSTYHSSIVHKARIRGGPFGFGLRQTDLSATQLAILAALGLSKL